MTQKGIFKDNFNNLICSGDKLVIKPSKRGFYVIFISKGVVDATRDYDIRFRNFHLQANSEEVRDVYHDNDNDLFWIAGTDLKVFSWDRKNLLLQLDNKSKPAFSSMQSETICPIAGTKKVLIGTAGSGIFLIEYEKKDSISNSRAPIDIIQVPEPSNQSIKEKPVLDPSPSIPSKANIDTIQVPKSKPLSKFIEKEFVLENFVKDDTIVPNLDMHIFFQNIEKNIDFKQVEIKKVKMEGYASKTGTGLDKAKTKEVSQRRINFIRQILVDKYSLSTNIFDEKNYGDTKPREKNDLYSAKNRAVVVTFKYEILKKLGFKFEVQFGVLEQTGWEINTQEFFGVGCLVDFQSNLRHFF